MLKAFIDSLKGIPGTGDILGRISEIGKNTDRILTMEPGDWAASSKKNPITMAAPIAYDVWYLHNHVNFITFIDESVNVKGFVSERLDFFADKLRIKPMLAVEANEAMSIDSFGTWKAKAKYFIQLMAFEIQNKNDSLAWDSFKLTEMDKDECVGYFAIPIGQLGVMEQIAFFQQSWTEEDDFQLKDSELPIEETPALLPPAASFDKQCFGNMLIERGYLFTEEYKNRMEYLSDPIPEVSYSKDIKPKGWLRLWVKREDTFPVPGEFIGFACKPVVAPFHCWWFQETSPFVYAGNWVDTRNLTSGVITEVTEGAEHPNGTSCTEYKIKIHGIELTVFSSDFLVYEVGKRVAVLKLESTEDESEKAFTFVNQKAFGDPEEGVEEENYVIIPMSFFVKE